MARINEEYHQRDEQGTILKPQENQYIEFSVLDEEQKAFRFNYGVYSNYFVVTKSGNKISLNDVDRWKVISEEVYENQ